MFSSLFRLSLVVTALAGINTFWSLHAIDTKSNINDVSPHSHRILEKASDSEISTVSLEENSNVRVRETPSFSIDMPETETSLHVGTEVKLTTITTVADEEKMAAVEKLTAGRMEREISTAASVDMDDNGFSFTDRNGEYLSTVGIIENIVSTTPVGSSTRSTALESTTAPTTARRKRTVLVTGGAGYIGSHTVLELLEAQLKEEDNDTNQKQQRYYYEIVVVDNLCNSSEESLQRVREITKCANHRLHFRKCDIRDKEALGKVLEEFPNISSCIHFAGLKAVGESVQKPLKYYDNNIHGTITLLQLLRQHGIKNFVFSSSATVYGQPETLPIPEDAPVSATSPYGRSKLFLEEILRDLHNSEPSFWNILLLRYFNPIGAHPSGQIGEDPLGIPNNLMPYVAQVCVGRRPKLQIFGNDYPTVDGTGVRDYIHVVDLAKGHVAALEKLYDHDDGGCKAINLGTGHGVSVLELVHGMAMATNQTHIPYEIVGRRSGDVAEIYADPTLAKEYLHWEAKLNVADMCTDTWRWQSKNPYGYNNTAPITTTASNKNKM